MHVLVKASMGWQRRHRDRRLQCKLTWEQLLEDLAGLHEGFGFRRYAQSKRALAYWLEALEAARFIHRHTETVRDRYGQIVYRLTTFTFGSNGILWIKNSWRDGAALLARSIVQKIAGRFKGDVLLKNRAVDKTIHSSEKATKKSAVLRRRTRSTLAGRAAPAPSTSKTPIRKGSRPAKRGPAPRTARARRRQRASR